MTNTRKFGPTDLSTAVSPARRRHRTLIEAALRWQSGRDRRLDPDLFALICAGLDDAAGYGGEAATPTSWTRTTMYHALRCDIPNWCSMARCRPPEELEQALWTWIDFLHETGRLDPASDPVAELRKPLICCGWLDQDGNPQPPEVPRTVECECFLPYRETAVLLNELVAQCERGGGEPLDRLRSLVGWPVRVPGLRELPWPGDGVTIDPDELWWAEQTWDPDELEPVDDDLLWARRGFDGSVPDGVAVLDVPLLDGPASDDPAPDDPAPDDPALVGPAPDDPALDDPAPVGPAPDSSAAADAPPTDPERPAAPGSGRRRAGRAPARRPRGGPGAGK